MTGVQTCALPISRLDDTIRAADTAAALLSKQPEVETVFEDVGQGGQDIRMAMLYLRLKEPVERDRTSVEFERETAPLLQAIPDARISFQSQKIGSASCRDRVCPYV